MSETGSDTGSGSGAAKERSEQAPMRVLVAIDGSPGSEVAVDLVAGLAWPAGSVFRFVSAVIEFQEIGYGLFGVPRPDVPVQQPYLDELDETLAAAVARVPHGATGDSAVLRGRPADAILADAAAFEPDLLVVGSRGHGPIATMLLGSVSAELVDRSPCPVLVARRRSVERMLLAYDGSPAAERALDLAISWPALRGHTTRVISVAQPPALWRAGISPAMYRQVMEDYGAALDALQAEYRDLAEDAARQLAASGTEASVSTPTGDAANEVLAASRQMDADLVVLGSRGRTGLQRLVLGSVARNVLVSADASVLVVHLPRAAEDAAER